MKIKVFTKNKDGKIEFTEDELQKEGFWSDTPFEYKAVAYMELPKPWEGGDADGSTANVR